ncbi:NAD(P)-binding protein [Coemansia reversa NRRL 1564]|uniref:NAD(P)-binding protein n=1 Tax=Coemansia reversa (strain ATCC 12441 / NRRL 1564) TaxID=763665 RepID=A0A2G5BEN3_COERN|nr:NAD(P)-binding protein [Coemansia reversa NRRL 1564]|eukprot:PIA17486.1 NAD(P)-binding protein [Coemansia reversa NRRL 1564]
MDSFFRNHLLYLLCTLFVTVASQLLAIVDALSNCWHVVICSLLSLLPKARVKFPVNRPSATYHPAVLITGTSSGIGHDTAVALASYGYTVFAGVRSWEDAHTQKTDALPNNTLVGAVIPVILDVASSDSVDQAYEQVTAQLSHCQIPLVAVINNAGITAFAPMDISTPAFVDHCMAVNFHGPLRVTQRFMPLLRASCGRIVNVSSVMSWLIGPGFGIYCASKAALSAASRSWRYELASNDMAVSVLEPGLTRTSLWANIEPQLELHHSRLNGIRSARDQGASVALPAMPGDEAVASVSPASMTIKRQSNGSDVSAVAAASASADGIEDAPTACSDDQELYGGMIRRIKLTNQLAPLFALPTRHAVGAIIHALTSCYPKSTYRVGWDSRLMHLVRWGISDEVMEWLCRAIGIVSEG